MKISKEGIVIGLAITVGTLSYFLYYRPRQEFAKRVEEKRLEKENRTTDFRLDHAKEVETTIMNEYRKSPIKVRLVGTGTQNQGKIQDWYFEKFNDDTIQDLSKYRIFIFNCDYSDEGMEIKENGNCEFKNYAALSGGIFYLIEVSWAGKKEPYFTKASWQISGKEDIQRTISWGRPLILTKIEDVPQNQD